jgi:hypothetical protein
VKLGKISSFPNLTTDTSFSIGESIHWSQKPTQSPNASPWSQPEALDVELTAYVLLAQLTKDRFTQKEVAKATAIVAWLAKQRNAYGGFSSTQVRSLLSYCHSSSKLRSCAEVGKEIPSFPSRPVQVYEKGEKSYENCRELLIKLGHKRVKYIELHFKKEKELTSA